MIKYNLFEQIAHIPLFFQHNTYNGIALVGSLMECRITEKTTLEITINGEKQEPITVSEKQIDINYKRTFNYEDFSWAK